MITVKKKKKKNAQKEQLTIELLVKMKSDELVYQRCTRPSIMAE